jgi:hypothetical protein
MGEFKFDGFWVFGRESTEVHWGGGPLGVHYVQFGGIKLCLGGVL